ncbi:prefoldin subunit 5-like [Megalopta genalis]|uniref:prefoldin subunit 5-like n=2 Tax=Megalopta genalis TaxID=115081 RepID=UPI003FD04A4F
MVSACCIPSLAKYSVVVSGPSVDRFWLHRCSVERLDQELEVFQGSLQTLKVAQSKFQESGSCLDKINPAMNGNEILVPLTGPMYVTGKLADTNNVLEDIGTGYFAEKSVAEAKDYFDRRVAYVTLLMLHYDTLNSTANVMVYLSLPFL